MEYRNEDSQDVCHCGIAKGGGSDDDVEHYCRSLILSLEDQTALIAAYRVLLLSFDLTSG